MSDEIAERLRLTREKSGQSQRVFSSQMGIALSTLQAIEGAKNVPNGETLLKYAALGWNPGWILTGQGFMHLEDPSEAGAMEAGAELVPAFDTELLGRIVDLIAREAKACGVSIPHVELGRKAGEKYAELVAASDNPGERLAMLKLMAVQLRNELRTPVVPGEGLQRKDSA